MENSPDPETPAGTTNDAFFTLDSAVMGEIMAAHAQSALAKSNGPVVRPPEPTMFSHWFPLIERAGLPVPRTLIVPGFTEEETLNWMDGERPPSLASVAANVAEAANALGGFPCFLRTGLTSGKREWKETCHLPSVDTIESHLYRLCEFSCLVDIFGLVCSEFVVRELVASVAPFTAFGDGMPVAREIRYFYEDGRLSAWQPYWPIHSIEDASCDDWPLRLAEISRFTDVEFAETRQLAVRAAQAASEGGLCSDWSVDLLQTQGGEWLVIDMADAARSYRSPDQRSLD